MIHSVSVRVVDRRRTLANVCANSLRVRTLPSSSASNGRSKRDAYVDRWGLLVGQEVMSTEGYEEGQGN